MSAFEKEKLDRFIQVATEEEQAQKDGNSKKTNKCYHILMETGKVLLEQEGGGAALFGLLAHENDSVVSWAAYFLLKNKKEEAVSALERISKKEGIIAFNAEMTLREFRSGRLKLQY
jgi:hypothetical protein